MSSEGFSITEADLEALALGAAVLGTGGGGSPYIGKLRLRELLRQGKTVTVVPLQSLPPDALVVSVGGIGAPVIGIEKLERGDECLQSLRALEHATGQKAAALIAAEIGGANSIEPMIVAAQTGLPVLDADGMGRAFPEAQMTTFFIYGHVPYPAALADDKGNQVVLQQVVDMYWLERFARTITVDMGASAGFSLPPMRADYLQRYAIPDTVTQALEIGRTVQRARQEHRNPITALCEEHDGIHLFSGKITDVRRELKGGFAVGEVKLEGMDAYRGESASINIQNENLVLRRGSEVIACVPDLIMILDVDTAEPITTEVLRFGQRVAVLGFPCHPLLKTPEALEVVGPAAFGYPEIPYRPLVKGGRAYAVSAR